MYFCAEIGINHNGDLDLAKKMIKSAKDNGANLVKFQKRTIDAVYSKEELEKPRDSQWGTTTREQKEGLEFGQEEYDEIDKYCKLLGIDWFASSWDTESQKFLRQYELKYNKVASPMLTNFELLETMASEKKLTFVSTGMSTIGECDRAVQVFRKNKCPFCIIHCVSTYPTQNNEINIRCVQTLQWRYPDSLGIGYSSHDKGINACVLARTLGAIYYEKHYTTDRTLYGSDQSLSFEPEGFRRMVRDVNAVDVIMGDGMKYLLDSEIPAKNKLRKQ